jgi:hypothetical protein
MMPGPVLNGRAAELPLAPDGVAAVQQTVGSCQKQSLAGRATSPGLAAPVATAFTHFDGLA